MRDHVVRAEVQRAKNVQGNLTIESKTLKSDGCNFLSVFIQRVCLSKERKHEPWCPFGHELLVAERKTPLTVFTVDEVILQEGKRFGTWFETRRSYKASWYSSEISEIAGAWNVNLWARLTVLTNASHFQDIRKNQARPSPCPTQAR
jgi:hypothetical protein